MKNKKIFLYLLLLFLSHFSVSSQELSNSVYNLLQSKGYTAVKQNLVNPGINKFPYNITLFLQPQERTDKKLLLVFNQEQVIDNQDVIIQTLNNISNNTYDFDIYILFSFGENQKIEKQGMISGCDSYLSSLTSYEDITCIIFDLNSKKNLIYSQSNGITAPAWMIKNEFNVFLKHGLSKNLPFYYISQLYKLPVFFDKTLNLFLQNDIPAIKVSLNTEKLTSDVILDIILDSVNKYSTTKYKIWDKHFLMIRNFLGYINLSEFATVHIILFIILIWLFFILFMFFINNSKRHHSWQKIIKIWYIVPVTFAAIVISFYEGRAFFNLFAKKLNDVEKIYFLFASQIFISFLNSSVLYVITLIFNKDFEAKSLDYLIVITAFINQSIFVLVDISLFPIFMTICLLSMLALIIKNNTLHIIIFILMIIPFIPYLHDIITYSNINLLKNYVLTQNSVLYAFTLVLYSIFIVYFRIITFYRNLIWKKRSVFIGTGISTAIIFIALSSIYMIRTKQISKTLISNNNVIIRKSYDDLINFNYFDKNVFSDSIRTININLAKNPVQCDVTLVGNSHSPIIYTDNDYENISQNSVYFKIPYTPPKNMTFSYGTEDEACTVKITAIFENEVENDFTLVTKIVSLGE